MNVHLHEPYLAISVGAFLAQLKAETQQPSFWFAIGKIVWINVLLSGDNALVIAMACRGLQGRSRFWGLVIGAGMAVVLLIGFTGVVATVMALPFLKLIGGLALLVVAARLLVPEDEADEIAAGTTLWHAIRIVVIADIVMSLDNVLAVAAAANGELTLVAIGLAVSIPMIVAGAALIAMALDRFPILARLGALLLGWIAGTVISSDIAVQPLLRRLLNGEIALDINGSSPILGFSPHLSFTNDLMETISSVLCALIVLIGGLIWRARSHAAQQRNESTSSFRAT